MKTSFSTVEDANIRAAQAILFRSRSKAAHSPLAKEGLSLKNNAGRLAPLTPGSRAAASPAVVSKSGARLDATPVKATNVTARTPNSALSSSGSKQRFALLVVQNECCCSLNQSWLIYYRLKRRWSGSAFNIISSK
jgi:hypothetical protein